MHELQNDAVFLLIFLFFLFSVYMLIKNRAYKTAGTILVSYAVFFIITFFGSQIGLSNMQPRRFILPLVLLSILSISHVINLTFKKRNAAIIFFLGLSVLLILSPPVKLRCGYKNPAAEKILDFIRLNTTQNARIHVQDGRWHPYFGSHFTSYIPHITAREILSSPFNYPPTKFGFTQFVDNSLFGTNLIKISKADLTAYLELYNIKYFLVFSNDTRIFFDRNPLFARIFYYDKYSIHEYVDAEESFCYKCNASVKADYDKIVVKNASSPVTILKYHYIKSLKITPASLIIKPVKILDDPVPFIQVENGNQRNFVIYN